MRRVKRDASRRAKLNATLQTAVQVNEVRGAAAYNITLSCGATLVCTELEMMIFQKNTANYKAAEQQGAITDSHAEVVRHETPELKPLHTLCLPYDKPVRNTMLPLSLIPAHTPASFGGGLGGGGNSWSRLVVEIGGRMEKTQPFFYLKLNMVSFQSEK